jgi:regulator of protease activity HflC (stomatin/prohibitin superfamily)
MLLLKYLLMIAGLALFGSAAGVVGYDVWVATQLQRLLQRRMDPADAATGEASRSTELSGASAAPRPLRAQLAGKIFGLGLALLLFGASIVVILDGYAGVRISQLSGVLPQTLYPGVHLVVPLVQQIETYDVREDLYQTSAVASILHKGGELLTVQAREGLTLGVGVSVRYRLDPQRLAYVHDNVPQPVQHEVVEPVVSSILRDVAASYVVRDIFSTRRDEFRQRASDAITQRLAADGIVVKEVMLRDIQLPAEYAKGLEGLLLKEQESEQMGFETDMKQKQVKIAELEGEAQKTRDIKQAEAAAQVHVLQAKAESDAMQYTLPLKQKQIEQTRLESTARKEATIQNAEAAAQSKIIDSKAELERRNLLTQADANHIRVTAAADSERMNLEAAALKSNPMLIQKIIAERLSDKLQIIMVPTDGKNFFAGDVLRSAFSATQTPEPDSDTPKTEPPGARRPNQQ